MRNVLTKLAVAAAALVGGVTSANAYLIMTVTDVSTATSVSCNTLTLAGCGAGGWSVTSLNQLQFGGAVGVFNVAATQGLSNTPGSPTLAFADTTSLSVTRTDGAAGLKGLEVRFDAIDFTAPSGSLKTLQGSASNTAGSGAFSPTDNVVSNFFVDSAGGTAFGSLSGPLFGPPVPPGVDGLYNTACFFFVTTSGNCDAPTINWSDPSAPGGTFSVRSLQRFNIAAGSRVNTTGSLTISNAVPEPMSTSLVGLALVGLALVSRRSAAKKA